MRRFYKAGLVKGGVFRFLAVIVLALSICSCDERKEETGKNKGVQNKVVDINREAKANMEKVKLPEDIEWLTNDIDPIFASPDAKRGALFMMPF